MEKINKDEGKELAPIKKEIATLISQISSLKVKTEEDKTTATSALSQINKYADSLKAKKETLTKPINEALKNIRSLFKPLEVQCEEATEHLRTSLSAYQTAKLAKQQAEEAKLAEKLAEGKITVDQMSKKMEKLPTLSTKTQTDDGDVSFVTVKKFEVTSLAALPITYHLADETAIRKALAQGIELPGVRYWEEQSVRNYR